MMEEQIQTCLSAALTDNIAGIEAATVAGPFLRNKETCHGCCWFFWFSSPTQIHSTTFEQHFSFCSQSYALGINVPREDRLKGLLGRGHLCQARCL